MLTFLLKIKSKITFCTAFLVSPSAILMGFKVMCSQQHLENWNAPLVAISCSQYVATIDQVATANIEYRLLLLYSNTNSCYKWVRPNFGLLPPNNETMAGVIAAAVCWVVRSWENSSIIILVSFFL